MGGEGRTVRPAVAGAQVEGQLGEILVPLVSAGDVGHDGHEVIRKAHEVHVAQRQHVGGARLGRVRHAVERATILADGFIGQNHQRFGGQAVFHARQFSRVTLDARVERGDLGVFLEAHFAACQGFEIAEVILLGIGPRFEAHHVGHGGHGAISPGCAAEGDQANGKEVFHVSGSLLLIRRRFGMRRGPG